MATDSLLSIKETEVREWLQHFKLRNLGNGNGSSRRKMQRWTAVREKSRVLVKISEWRGPKRDRNNMCAIGPKDINLNFIKPEPMSEFYRVNKSY